MFWLTPFYTTLTRIKHALKGPLKFIFSFIKTKANHSWNFIWRRKKIWVNVESVPQQPVICNIRVKFNPILRPDGRFSTPVFWLSHCRYSASPYGHPDWAWARKSADDLEGYEMQFLCYLLWLIAGSIIDRLHSSFILLWVVMK